MPINQRFKAFFITIGTIFNVSPHFMYQPTTIEVPGYSIKEVLGTGGSATVFLARHHALQRDVALKILNIELANNPHFCQRFVREALDTASISEHPNVMTIFDAGHHNGIYFIALQYLSGLSLQDQIETGHPRLKPWDMMYQLAGALAHVHGKGFVHRDIKPANVLFNISGHPILADFGVAQLESNLNRTIPKQQRPGTRKYMSPEQLKGTVSPDARSDFYSLGLVFYEILTGETLNFPTPPIATQPLRQYLSCRIRQKNEHLPRLPPSHAHFQAIIDQLLEPDPKDRLQTADQLLTALESLKVSSNNHSALTSHNKATATLIATKKGRFKTSALLTAPLMLIMLMASSSHTDGLIREHTSNNQCPVIDEAQAQVLNKIVRLAKMHYQVGKLTFPPGSNAIDAYSTALAIDPCNRYILDSLKLVHNKALESQSKINTNAQDSSVLEFPTESTHSETTAYKKLEFGRYHALIIGNQVYENLVNLPDATHDALAIERTLAKRFGFNTTLLKNATQKQILIALEQLRATLSSKDNLLIFYLGHGELDNQTSRGYWLPTDANVSDVASWIPNHTVKTIVGRMLAKHILIVANNCYSSTVSTSQMDNNLPKAELADEIDWFQANLSLKVRTGLCAHTDSLQLLSTNNAKISPFPKAFIDTLTQSKKPIGTYQLIQQVQKHLSTAATKPHSEYSLQYAPIHSSGHQSGEFVFVPITQD